MQEDKKKRKTRIGDRLTISFWPQQRNQLLKIAEENHVSLNFIVCSAVSTFINQNRGKRLRVQLAPEE